MSIEHHGFTLERTYPRTAAEVFNAFRQPELKRRWFAPPEDWSEGLHELDFRVGGAELSGARDPTGTVHSFRARYHDIVEDERIVYAYEMRMDERLSSVSLATIELEPADDGTKLTLTEQGAFFDGFDDPELRVNGTGTLLDSLGELLR